MLHDKKWLHRTIGITEGRPYQGILAHECEGGQETQGITVLHVGNGSVRFEFYVDQNTDHAAFAQAARAGMAEPSQLELAVPSAKFQHPVRVLSVPTGHRPEQPMKGAVEREEFGTGQKIMSQVEVELLDIPDRWGDRKSSYQFATSKYPLKFSDDNEHILIPTDTMGARLLSGCTIKAGRWAIEIQEIPQEQRRHQRITHRCVISRINSGMTGTSGWKFFDEELRPFLCFLFAHNVQATHMAGVGWIKLRAVRPENVQTYGENWLLSAPYRSIDLQALFQGFHSQTAETKKHWRKVIDRYATSEEIIATLGDPETAEAVSFAGLDGLTRSIISRYSDKNLWLDSKLRLKRRRRANGEPAGITDAIEKVLKQELATNNPELMKSLSRLAHLRNSTAHTDLLSHPDWPDSYHRWNASQALTEILLLSKMGLKEIPNRTQYPTFGIMGHDMYKDARKETILAPRCQNCGEWTGTITHRECNQNLCSPCWEQHNQTGCTDVVYPLTQ